MRGLESSHTETGPISSFGRFSFPGSAWERTAFEALPRVRVTELGIITLQVHGWQSLRCSAFAVYQDGSRAWERVARGLSGSPIQFGDAARQIATLQTVEEHAPDFFAALVEHTYRGYYTLPAVHHAIGHESRPPQPLGHSLAPFDPALLDSQRQRLPFWRKAP